MNTETKNRFAGIQYFCKTKALMIVEDPLKAVARGTCLALKGSDRYPFLMK